MTNELVKESMDKNLKETYGGLPNLMYVFTSFMAIVI